MSHAFTSSAMVNKIRHAYNCFGAQAEFVSALHTPIQHRGSVLYKYGKTILITTRILIVHQHIYASCDTVCLFISLPVHWSLNYHNL